MKEQFLQKRTKLELRIIAYDLGVQRTNKMNTHKLISILLKYSYKQLKESLNKSNYGKEEKNK